MVVVSEQSIGGYRQKGLTYLALIFAVAILSLASAATSELWSTAQRRDKERELLIVGNQFRQAIGRYYEASPGGAKKYPYSLEDLLKDNRHLVAHRHLRKIYPDPINGKAEWGIVQAPTGGIMGVHSLLEAKPIKSANFEPRDKEFEAKDKYAEWKFVYVPELPQTPLTSQPSNSDQAPLPKQENANNPLSNAP